MVELLKKIFTVMCLATIIYFCVQNEKLNWSKEKKLSVVSNKNLDNSWAPSWLPPAKGITGDLDNEQTCRPVTNIAYAKIPKTGSTAIQGILVRYGLKHNLTFVLPPNGNAFTLRHPFKRQMMSWQTMRGLVNFNIFAVHCIWNMEEIRKLMPPDTIFIASFREPVELFLSSYQYAHLSQRTGMNINEFIQKNSLNMTYTKIAGYNLMLRALGTPGRDLQDSEIVQNQINYFDNNFDLILLNEKMNESLVLLRHLLCWDTKDMVTFKVNARREQVKLTIDDKMATLLQQRLQPDTLLYNHFNNKMESLIRNFGEKKMRAEVKELKEAIEEVKENCNIKQAASIYLKPEQQILSQAHMVLGLSGKMDTEECKPFSVSGPYLLNSARKKQRMTPP